MDFTDPTALEWASWCRTMIFMQVSCSMAIEGRR